jgi:hypothetical protein
MSGVFELRQYTLHPGKRDTLIELFEREFLDTQEAAGIRVIGQFRDVNDPDRFVWFRGFPDMEQRTAALERFYGGDVWKTHRDAANATMIDSDDVLLLRLVDGFAFPPSTSGLLHVTVFAFDAKLLDELDAPTILWTEHAKNGYPRLPVREGENVIVTLTREPIVASAVPMQRLVLEATERSALR